MIRDDISTKLIHLTRDKVESEIEGPDRIVETAPDKFMNIVRTETLLGGTGTIKGGFRCVCFSEAPIGKLAQLFSFYLGSGDFRYAPLGVMVDKTWLFDRGGLPVIYQPAEEYDCLPDSHKYRHVRYEPNNGIDYTWEREWRICTSELKLEPDKTTLVVPTRQWERKFIDDVIGAMKRKSAAGSYALGDIKWHFIVLEDFGIEIPYPNPD